MGLINFAPIQDGDEANDDLFNSRLGAIVDVLNGNVDEENLKTSAVTTSKLGDAAVTTVKMADGAATDAKWRNGVAFRARRTATYNTPANAQTNGFIFDTVAYNYGNAYSASTGLFTAPVNGIYAFKVAFFTESAVITRAFPILRGTITSGYRTRNFDGDATAVKRAAAVYEFDMTAGTTVGFEVWTSGAVNLASADTWVTGHLVTRL